MSAGQAGYDSNRLPWLNDTATPVVKPARRASPLGHFFGGVAAAFLIAGASYWIGLRSILPPEPAAETAITVPGPTYETPQQIPAEEKPQAVERPVMPQVVLVPQPAPFIIRQAAPVSTPGDAAASAEETETAPDGSSTEPDATSASEPAAAQPQVQPAPVRSAPLTLWPADRSEGASGRAIRIGTYASRLQAKRAWRKLVRLYPGMGRLKAVVAPAPSARNGKTYYRLQFGTTSHAHSAVLCQRMRIVGQSCVVLGTPQGSGAAGA